MLFNGFKKRAWKPEVLPLLKGQEKQLVMELSGVPCLRDEATGDRKYAYPDFGHDFLKTLHTAMGEEGWACSQLLAGQRVTATVNLVQYSPIQVTLSGNPGQGARGFESDIADAVISAFESAGLKPR